LKIEKSEYREVNRQALEDTLNAIAEIQMTYDDAFTHDESCTCKWCVLEEAALERLDKS
jgi:hypothetical protein